MRRLPHPPKYYQALRETAARTETGLYLIEGPKLIQEALFSLPRSAFHAILWREDEKPSFSIPADLLYPVAPWLLARITTLDTAPAGIAIAYQTSQAPQPSHTPALFLEGLQDPGNVGTLLRLAEWFGIRAVWLSPDSIDPFHPKVVRASMGSLFRLNLARTRDWQALLQAFPGQIAVATLHGVPPDQISWQTVAGLYLGSEGQGIRHAPPHGIPVHIPKAPSARAESLNVATAGAILLYCWRGLQTV
jgi:TrmH family RNA methyltransferase